MYDLLLENKHLHMTHLTRDVLIKAIVAEEMKDFNGEDYFKSLKDAYHKWEHQSSDVLCNQYNSINKTKLTVDELKP